MTEGCLRGCATLLTGSFPRSNGIAQGLPLARLDHSSLVQELDGDRAIASARPYLATKIAQHFLRTSGWMRAFREFHSVPSIRSLLPRPRASSALASRARPARRFDEDGGGHLPCGGFPPRKSTANFNPLPGDANQLSPSGCISPTGGACSQSRRDRTDEYTVATANPRPF
jgi:hypothetical protein